MAKKRYELGVIGCGKIWEIGHLTEIRVRYVYDVNDALAAKAAEETGAICLGNVDRMFNDPDVDIVGVYTPPAPRLDCVRKACAAGKHLMLEKPMARTVDQALEIVRCVRESNVKCLVAFVRALAPTRRELFDAIRAGTFGEPLAWVHMSLGVPYGWIPLDHWMHDEAQSGGPLFDYSIHFIDMARACFGEAESALYGGADLTGRVKSHDLATLMIDYAAGGIGQFTKSWAIKPDTDYGHNLDHVICRDATIVLGPKTEIHTPDGVREFEPTTAQLNGRVESYRNLIAGIESDTPQFADEVAGLRINEVLDAMERSRASGKREQVVLHDV